MAGNFFEAQLDKKACIQLLLQINTREFVQCLKFFSALSK